MFTMGTPTHLEFESGFSELSELNKHSLMLQAGYTLNEVREMRNQTRINDPKFDLPAGFEPQATGETENKPMFVQNAGDKRKM